MTLRRERRTGEYRPRMSAVAERVKSAKTRSPLREQREIESSER